MESRNYTRGRPRGLDASIYGRRLILAQPRTPRGDSTNTGFRNYPRYSGLTDWVYGGVFHVTTGTTLTGQAFNGGMDVGTTSVPANNVTFNGCRFYGAGGALVNLYGDNAKFNYCSFEPDNAYPVPPSDGSQIPYASGYQYGINGGGSFNSSIQQLTVDHCDMWGFGNAIDIQGSTQAKPQVFTNSWIHDARADGGIDHTDGIGSLGGVTPPGPSSSYVVLQNNTIESLGNTNGIAFQLGVYDHFTIVNNLIGGWGKAVAVWSSNTNTIFTDNVFSTRLPVGFGPLYDSAMATTTGSLWRRNRWHVPAGAAWGNPARDGYFWIPDASNSPTDDTPFVSLTDFAG